LLSKINQNSQNQIIEILFSQLYQIRPNNNSIELSLTTMSGLVPLNTSHKRASEADQHLVQERKQRLCTEKSQSIDAMALIQGYSDEDEMSDEEEQDVQMQKQGVDMKEKAKGSDEEGGVSYSEYRKELMKTDLTPHWVHPNIKLHQYDAVGNAEAVDEGVNKGES